MYRGSNKSNCSFYFGLVNHKGSKYEGSLKIIVEDDQRDIQEEVIQLIKKKNTTYSFIFVNDLIKTMIIL